MLDYTKMETVEKILDEAENKDLMIKYLIESADFEIAYYLVCKYITKRSVQELHKSIISNISSSKSTLDLAPRGFGKSTVGDVDYCITSILRDPNIRIMIGSKTQTQAEAFLKEVRSHFEQNEDLLRIFGDWKPDKGVWNDREFVVSKRNLIKKEATLTALGASGAVISKHFDVIIGDDLVGLENARTERQRANLKEWFYSSLFPTLEPDGEIHILGTRYNPLDLYEDLIKSRDYVVNIQKAITTDKKGNKCSLWESKFTLERLEAILKQSGKIIFNMQYQNDTELAKGKIFKAKYFRYYEEYKLDYDFQSAKIRIRNEEGIDQWIKVRVYFGCDLAISEKESDKGDYFVCMAIGVDVDRNVYVLEYIKERLTFNAQLNAIISYGRDKYPMVERIGVETVAYQKSLAQELRRLSLLPIININTSKDKVTRAMRRSANFENGKVFFRSDMDDLEECLLLFPEVEHDDLFDALDFACAMADNSNEAIIHSREDFYI